MGSYTCAGYSRLSTGIAGERTGGTRQHTMQTAQSLEEQANMFLSVADATTEEGSLAGLLGWRFLPLAALPQVDIGDRKSVV